MQALILIFTAFIGVALGIYNGWIYKMAVQRNERFNTLNHYISGFIRFIIIGVILWIGVYLHSPIENIVFNILFAGVFFWPVYNLLYNLIHTKRWNYLGSKKSNTKSFIDRTFHKFIIPVQIVLTLIMILYYPLNIYDQFIYLVEALKERWFEIIGGIMLFITVVCIAFKFNKK